MSYEGLPIYIESDPEKCKHGKIKKFCYHLREYCYMGTCIENNKCLINKQVKNFRNSMNPYSAGFL
jgi:hypothetical protein